MRHTIDCRFLDHEEEPPRVLVENLDRRGCQIGESNGRIIDGAEAFRRLDKELLGGKEAQQRPPTFSPATVEGGAQRGGIGHKFVSSLTRQRDEIAVGADPATWHTSREGRRQRRAPWVPVSPASAQNDVDPVAADVLTRDFALVRAVRNVRGKRNRCRVSNLARADQPNGSPGCPCKLEYCRQLPPVLVNGNRAVERFRSCGDCGCGCRRISDE